LPGRQNGRSDSGDGGTRQIFKQIELSVVTAKRAEIAAAQLINHLRAADHA